MTVVIQEVIEHGKHRWVRTNCPDCGKNIILSTHLSEENKQTAQCSDCGAKFIVTWDESDEAMT